MEGRSRTCCMETRKCGAQQHYITRLLLSFCTFKTTQTSRKMILFASIAILSLLASVTARPLPELSSPSRFRRKVGQLEVGSTALTYMREIMSNLADDQHRPRSIQQGPTSVWCFLDRGKFICVGLICLFVLNPHECAMKNTAFPSLYSTCTICILYMKWDLYL